MKHLHKIIALTAILATPALAQEGHQHGDDTADDGESN